MSFQSRLRKNARFATFTSVAVTVFLGVACTQDRESGTAEIELLLNANRMEEAMPRLEALLDEYPDDQKLNSLYGRVHLGSGNPSIAIWPLRRATESPDAGPEDWMLLAQAHLRGGSPTDSIAVIDALLERTPGILEAYDLRIEANMALSLFEKALEDVEYLLDDRPDDESLLVTKVSLLLELERPEEASEAITAAKAVMGTGEAPSEWHARFCAVDATFIFEKGEEGFAERATEAWEGCLEAHPADELVVTSAINFFQEQGQGDRGESILRNAVETAPESAGFKLMLGQRLAVMGEQEEAEEMMRESIALPGGQQGRTVLIDYLSERERYGEALVILEEWIAMVPNPPASMQILRADLLVRSGRFEEAEKAIAGLQKQEFRDVLNGRLALSRGEPQKALELLGKGIALWPNNNVARVLMAEAAEQLGDFDRAFSEYVEACRSETGDEEALTRLGEMHVAVRRTEPFTQLFGRYIRASPSDIKSLKLAFEVGFAGNRDTLARTAINGLRQLRGGQSMSAALEARLLSKKSPKQAIEWIRNRRLNLKSPENVELLEVLVEILGRAGNHKSALVQIDAAIEAFPDFGRFHAIRAAALEASAAPPGEVRAALEQTLALDENHAKAHAALGRLEAAEGNVDAALRHFDLASASEPDDSGLQWTAIEALMAAGQESEADARLEKLVSRNIEHAGAVELYARRLEARGDNAERAKKYADLALRLAGGGES